MEKNKIGKYFKYAIGEIVLVVIGILIALQVNTLKEEKQAKEYELIILKENLKQLKEDLNRFEEYKKEVDNTDKSLRYLIKYLNSDNTQTDSLKFHIEGIRIKNFMVYNKSAYESLKSGGLERLSNDSIRTALSSLYETYYPGAEIIVNNILYNDFRSWENNYSTLFLDGFEVESNGFISERINSPNRKILEDSKFTDLIQNTVSIIELLRNTYERYLIPKMNKVIDLIEAELEKK